jgi:hypothetical protein
LVPGIATVATALAPWNLLGQATSSHDDAMFSTGFEIAVLASTGHLPYMQSGLPTDAFGEPAAGDGAG